MTKARKSPAGTLIELAVIVVTALGLALAVQAFLVKPYRIPSGSMLPTVRINQRVLVDRLAMDFSSPHVGDIMVFHPPKNYDDGCANPGEGENQSGQYGAVRVPGGLEAALLADVHQARGRPPGRSPLDPERPRDPQRQARAGLLHRAVQRRSDPATSRRRSPFPAADYYMMGDNRPDSEDSRFWGPVPRSWIIGKAFLTYWPPDRIGFL